MADEKKKWGKHEFWGLGYEFDTHWVQTEKQKDLQKKLIDLCHKTLRRNGIKSDRTYEFPRENLEALAKIGLLGLIVPPELGGLGENHQCAAMVCETIARYGCPSTALIYVMHLCAVAILLVRHHKNELIKDLLSRLDSHTLIGTIAFTDPSTGGHLWYSLSSKCWQLADGSFKVLKFSSWTTSAGFADWYIAQIPSPNFDGDFSNLCSFLFYKSEVRAGTEEWSALGMHGNQSGPLVCEGVLKPDRLIGPQGDGKMCLAECMTPWFTMTSSAVWNGIAMAAIDLAKRHVCSKTHGDVGFRVSEYSTIQGYFGEQLSLTNASRCMTTSVASLYDLHTNNNDWSIYEDVTVTRRASFKQWGMQAKLVSSQNASQVVDVMMQACGGTGYKTELGLERLLRDAKAGCLMASSNENVKISLGKQILAIPVDLWNAMPNDQILKSELRKLTPKQKKELAEQLLEEDTDFPASAKFSDFDNPLSCCVPTTMSATSDHEPALTPDSAIPLKLARIRYLTVDEKNASFLFHFPKLSQYSGCLSGQYVQMVIPGSETHRYISPVSKPNDFGNLDIVVKFESQGVMADYLKQLEIGDEVLFRGPCGGFEYRPNRWKHLIFLCGGIGVTPAIQILRTVVGDQHDQTNVTIFYQARNIDELLFKGELDELRSVNRRVNVLYTIQDVDDTWNGSEGHIDIDLLKLNILLPCTDGSTKVIVSGGGQMIVHCVNALCILKFRSQDIFIYGPFADEQIKSMYGRSARLFEY